MKRRDFMGLVAGAGLLTPLRRAYGSVTVPQTPLPGKSIPRFVEALPTFAGNRISGTDIVVSMEEFEQQVLPAGFPKTRVWGYKVGGQGPHFPGVTIEAVRGTPTTVTYINNLSSPKLQPYLTADQTIHFADPLDTMGSFQPYNGPIPTVTHLHGAEVPSAFDGGPDEWFTATGLRGPGYSTARGTKRNQAIYVYPNTQEATTLWFHDHALGMTRLNVYAGLAAFYLLRDSSSLDTGIPTTGGLPAGPYEIELAIQDRQFDLNGQLYFPDGSGSGLNGTPPNPEDHPFWIPEFFGDVIVVNGKSWPYLEVEPRRYRFRLLDGSNARFYELHLMGGGHQSGPPFWVIGTDGGLLDFPVKLSDGLLMAPGERFDVIIDFAGQAGKTFTLTNGAKAPFPNGMAPDPSTFGQVMQFRVTKPLQGTDTSYNPAAGGALRPLIVRLANPSTGTLAVAPDLTRRLVLFEHEGPGGPMEVLLNNTHWDLPLTELPKVGSTEVWEIINTTGDAHPIHIHLIQFQLINRQAFNNTQYFATYSAAFPGGTIDGNEGDGPPPDGNPDVTPFLQGNPMPPLPQETGWKDTLKMYPGQVTRIAVRFAPVDKPAGSTTAGTNYFTFDPTVGPGYVWHCHILDHEDNEMMRPYHPVFT